MMKITFDSNVYRRVVNPTLFPNDQDLAAIQSIHSALKSSAIVGFLSASVGTLEGVERKDRPTFFASRQLQIDFKEEEADDGTIRFSVTLGPRDHEFPPLNPTFEGWLMSAAGLGFRF